MSNENALFDDDFEDVFSEDPLSDLDQPDIEEVQIVTEEAAPEPAHSGLMADNDAHGLGHAEPMGGDVMLPAISIKLFYERPETRGLLEVCAQDRRMGRATIECIPGGIPAAIAYMSENPTPNLLMIESSDSAGQVLREIDALAEHCDDSVKVMVIGAVNDITLYRQLIARGVSEYLVPPFQPLQIIRSVADLFVNPDSPFVGKQISVVGAKGGVGASTIAHNLSWALSENIKVNTTLVDLDLSFGTTALDFNQETPQTVADALLAPERADESVIERLLAKPTDRLSLFTAPATINQIMDIPDEAYSTVIEGVRRNVPYLVLDLPHMWSTWMLNTLVASDEVIVVCQPDLASLRNGKNMIDQLRAKRPNDHPPRLVLNMSGVPKRPEIPVKDFAAAIGVEPDVILPFDPELFGTAANNGQMISETDPASKSAQAIDHLASTLTGRVVEPQEKSFFKKLLGK